MLDCGLLGAWWSSSACIYILQDLCVTARRICTINRSAGAGEDGAQLGALHFGNDVINRCGVQRLLACQLLSNRADELAWLAKHAAHTLAHRRGF